MALTLASPGSRAHRLDLVAGTLALNFTNTSSGRDSAQHIEHLRAPGDVLAWAQHAGILGAESLAAAAALADPANPEGRRLFDAALALRETVFCIGVAYAESRAPAAAALQDLRAIHARTLATAQLLPRAEGGYAWHWAVADDAVNAVIGPLALSAVSLLLALDLSRVKQCSGQHCGWLFFDATKNKRRRWCEMSVCGNRAKQRKLRQRRHQDAHA